MILNKALLLKCLGGVAACTGVAGIGILGSQQSRGNNKSSNGSTANNLQTESIVKKAGLNCDDENSTTGSNCTKKDGHGNISVKKGETSSKFEVSTLPTDSSQGKIKLYKDSGTDTTNYNEGFKLVIEEGDIAGTTNSDKLEQFETYEIKEESGSYILFRKTKASEGIKTALGLPSDCSLPEESSTSGATCTISTSNIGTVKFDGVSDGQTVTSSGDITLTITKLSTSEEDFPFDYKFELKGNSTEVSLSLGNSKSISLKSSEGTEFKIKKTTGNSITLEEAWSLARLLEKVGLSGCTTAGNGTECTIGSLKVKHESGSGEENKTKDTSNGGSPGKIKVYSDTTYNKGFKFVIEEGDISLTGDSGTVNKLEQFETYEIKKDETDNKWYLTRKTKATDEIKKLLGLPDSDCNLPTNEGETSTCCDLDAEKLKKIKFDGKPENQDTSTSGTTKLTITKVSDDSKSNFPLGYKFAFESTQDITIPQSSGNIYIKKKTNTEFKIKVTQSSGSTPVKLSLEKAWTAKTLGEKVGLSCPDSNGEKKCDFTEGSINVNNGSDNSKITNGKFKNSSEATGKKITYEEDQEGYNQGIKFYLDETNDIALTNDANGSADGSEEKKICKKGDNGTATYYEIKEDGGTWYLTKHTNS